LVEVRCQPRRELLGCRVRAIHSYSLIDVRMDLVTANFGGPSCWHNREPNPLARHYACVIDPAWYLRPRRSTDLA